MIWVIKEIPQFMACESGTFYSFLRLGVFALKICASKANSDR